MDEFDDLSKVRHVQPGDPTAARVTSQPTRALELRLSQLEERFDAFSQMGEFGSLVIRNVPIKTGDLAVVENDVVFFNSNTGLYEKAQAGVTFTAEKYISNPSALAIGVCVAVNGSNGDIMVAGYAPMTDQRKTDMPESVEDFQPGVYYLSDNEPGKITRYAPALRIQVLVATNSHFVLTPSYATPEGLEVLYKVGMGMRPVGGLRAIPPSFEQHVIVGFDALELYDEDHNLFRSTADSDITDLAQFGYMVADARITTQPASPRYVQIHIAKQDGGGNSAISVKQADTLAGLEFASPVTGFAALNASSSTTARSVAITDSTNNQIGTLYFRFVSGDGTYARDVYFKFPDSFQGWKMINAPITPVVDLHSDGTKVTGIDVIEGGIGFITPPAVVIDPPTGLDSPVQATAVAVLNELGTVIRIDMLNAGNGYLTEPNVVLQVQVAGIRVENGGKGAVLGITQSGGVINNISVTDGGSEYWTAPSIIITDPTGQGAIAIPEIINGVIQKITIVDGGTGYTSPRAFVRPSGNFHYASGKVRVLIEGGNLGLTGLNAAATANLSTCYVERVEVLCGGAAYDPGTTLGISGNAILFPEIDGDGVIVAVRVLDPGSGYTDGSTPTITPGSVVNGNGFVGKVILGRHVEDMTVTINGHGFGQNPTAVTAVPIELVEIDEMGTGYDRLSPPVVTFSLPDDPGGTQATGTARVGGTLKSIKIAAAGSGYSTGTTATVVGTGTGGVVQLGINAAGEIVTADIINPGYGYSTAPTISLGSVGGGTGGSVTVEIEGADGVVAIEITNNPTGYSKRPTITIAPPTSGLTARATGKLLGEGATLTPALDGDGGIRLSPPVTPPTSGNALQFFDYHDDLDDGGVPFRKANGTAFYYNIKADPLLSAKWPPVPVMKAILSLNGVALNASALNETDGNLTVPLADIAFSRKTIMWPTFDVDGCPWDREFRQYVSDLGSAGADHIIPLSGPTDDVDAFWRFWENVYKYEPYRNVAQLDINRASRFYQSNRLSALGVLAPLKAVDLATGNDLPSDGTLLTGQVVLRLDNETSLFGGTLEPIQAEVVNTLVPIFQNKTGKPVMVSSIVLMVTHQTTVAGALAVVTDAAKITIGTQGGNYRDICGTIDPAAVTQAGVSTCLYGVNQAKELFPDARESAPLIMPNDMVYARIDNPVDTNVILTQRIVARLKGHVL